MLDLVHGPATLHAGCELHCRFAAIARVVVALLDQEPILPFAFAGPGLHADENVIAIEAIAVQPEFEIALGQALVRIAERLPGAAVPDHHRACAILASGDHALEFAVFQRMVLGHHREPLLRRVEARATCHRPALQYPVMLEPEVEMRAARRMFLNDETIAL